MLGGSEIEHAHTAGSIAGFVPSESIQRLPEVVVVKELTIWRSLNLVKPSANCDYLDASLPM